MTIIKIRPAERAESRIIGTFYREAAEGVADYIWSTMAEGNEDLLDVAERRFARSGTPFSFENALMADDDGTPVGMVIGFPMHCDPDEAPCDDPVLAPYAGLELDNSYYLAGFLVQESHRNRGIGRHLMTVFETKARNAGYSQVSLIAFASNRDGLRLYHRLGFQEIDRAAIVPHPMIHSTGDALLLAKELDAVAAA